MKQNYKKYEMLSAYIDGELTENEKKQLEEELNTSNELRQKLAELKRIKQLTSQSVDFIPENPYFETRLAADMRLKKPLFTGIKKWVPVFGVALMTITLMVVLKLNPGFIDNLLNEQKTNLTAFYKQNLKPLLYAADLSNEDIFDFAFYHRLPLDQQKKQYLQLDSDPTGHQSFEIKTAGVNQSTNNLDKFIQRLDLSKRQQLQVDSILSSYADDLQNQVLVNDKNTVAINTNLWNYNKALMADLLTFASKANKKEFEKAVPAGFPDNNESTVSSLVNEIKASQNNKYIFFTPDSIFSDSFTFDKQKFKQDMNKMKEDMKKNFAEAQKQMKEFNLSFQFDSGSSKLRKDSSWNKQFKVYFDTNSCSVHLGDIFIPKIQIPNIDSISKQLELAAKNFKAFSFNIPSEFGKNKGKNYNFKYHYNDSTKSYDFNFKAFGMDSTGKFGNRNLDSLFAHRFKNFKNRPDSLASMFKFFSNDSTMIFQGKQFQEQMKELQKEMEKFRKEMQNMQKEFKMKNPPKKESNSIVI